MSRRSTDRNLLESCLTPERVERLAEVLRRRTVSITVVLDNLHKEHNADAVMRTCEAVGIQHVHVIPQPGDGRIRRLVTQGCHRWLTIHRHISFQECFRRLRVDGYRILVGSLGVGAVPLGEVDFAGRVALVFGNELEGAGEDLVAEADGRFVIPLAGFTQSLNVSVAAGITLQRALDWKKERSEALEGLPEGEARELMDRWVKNSVKRADRIIEELRSRE